jgi:hypothetical protein
VRKRSLPVLCLEIFYQKGNGKTTKSVRSSKHQNSKSVYAFLSGYLFCKLFGMCRIFLNLTYY